MWKQGVLLALLAVIAAVSAKDSQVFYEKRCVKTEQVACKIQSICMKVAKECVKHRSSKVCLDWQRKVKIIDEHICEKYVDVLDSCGRPTGRKACADPKIVKKESVKVFCAKWGKKKFCTKAKTVCQDQKETKLCSSVEPKHVVTGPRTCPNGSHMVFTKTHDGEQAVVDRSCNQGPAPAYSLQSCSIYNDPHFQNFDNQFYNHQDQEGDFNVATTADGVFATHLRFVRMITGPWHYAGIAAAAFRVNGQDVFAVFPSGSTALPEVYLNGQKFPLSANDHALAEGGFIRASQNQVQIFAPNGAQAIVYPVGWNGLINVKVSVPSNVERTGLCVANIAEYSNPVTGLFEREYITQFHAEAFMNLNRETDETAEKHANLRCSAAGFTGGRLDACVFDMLTMGHPDDQKIVLSSTKLVEEIHNSFVAHPIVQLQEPQQTNPAQIFVAADNWLRGIYVNGQLIGGTISNIGWTTVQRFSTVAKSGDVIAIEVQNNGPADMAAGNPGGILAEIHYYNDRGEQVVVSTDATWRCMGNPPSNWDKYTSVVNFHAAINQANNGAGIWRNVYGGALPGISSKAGWIWEPSGTAEYSACKVVLQ